MSSVEHAIIARDRSNLPWRTGQSGLCVWMKDASERCKL